MKVYHFDTELTEGKLKGKTVQEAFDEDKKIIFKLIKKYKYSFDDEVLAAAGIKKIVRDVTFTNVIVDHDQPKPNNKKLKKDKKSLDEILDEMCDERMNIKEDYDYNTIDDNDINNAEMPVDPEI
jgi:hypothetical protein